MSTTLETFLYLQRDIEQSFRRLQHPSSRNHHELDQLVNHISCTLDDLQKVNQLLQSSCSDEPSSVHIVSNPPGSELDSGEEEESTGFISRKPPIRITTHEQTRTGGPTVGYSKENEPSPEERTDFIQRMAAQLESYKSRMHALKKEAPMEIIRLDPPVDDDDDEQNDDRLIRKQDEQLDGIHHSIVSLKNLTQTMNFEINDHLRVLDGLETGMIQSQNGVENLTKQTKHFIRTSPDGVGGHTCLFAIAVGLFFLIIILILFF